MPPTFFPSLCFSRTDKGILREQEVLERLSYSLPEDYAIFHTVAWHTLHHDRDHYGEIDIVVVAPSGNLLLMEVKAGEVRVDNQNLVKQYGQQVRQIEWRNRQQHAAMVGALQRCRLHAHVTSCLVLPDCRVGPYGGAVGLPRERIIDADSYDRLGTLVKSFMTNGHSHSAFDAIVAFLSNHFRVSQDLRHLGKMVRNQTMRLSEGLATWVPRITSPSGGFHIQATAGSGKTQLALTLLNEAAHTGQHALYVCFNRSLADCMRARAPASTSVMTFHERCLSYWKATQGDPACFSDPAFFSVLEGHYLDAEFPQDLDCLIIDEGQDFVPDWVNALLRQVKETGRFYILEDEAQRLYSRQGFVLPEAVRIECHDNFRTPCAIVRAIEAWNLSPYPIDAKSPYEGQPPQIRYYDDEADLEAQTREAVDALRNQGIPPDEIVVLSAHGLTQSRLVKKEKLGGHTLRRFTGNYNEAGEALWSEGDILMDSVYRYKGQSCTALILTEVDFSLNTEMGRRKLFVAMTRALLSVTIIAKKGVFSVLG
jgi:hypothetical protein